MAERKLTELEREIEERYKDLAAGLGDNVALFCLCATYNIEYDQNQKFVFFWEYRAAKRGKKFNPTDVNFVSVVGLQLEGDTNHTEDELPEKEEPQESREERWKREWGTGIEEQKFTQDDYESLDEHYKNYSSRAVKAGILDEQMEDSLRSCSLWRLLADKAVLRGDKESITTAKYLNAMIQEQLASEQLRRKDAKENIEVARVDGIVELFAKKYGVKGELTRDEAVGICCRWLQGHKYPITLDAAEQILLSIYNTGRENSDKPTVDVLPDEMRIPKIYAKEFMPEQSEAEEEAYDYLGLVPFIQPKKKHGKGNGHEQGQGQG